jgi:hypothetical protein
VDVQVVIVVVVTRIDLVLVSRNGRHIHSAPPIATPQDDTTVTTQLELVEPLVAILGAVSKKSPGFSESRPDVQLL